MKGLARYTRAIKICFRGRREDEFRSGYLFSCVEQEGGNRTTAAPLLILANSTAAISFNGDRCPCAVQPSRSSRVMSARDNRRMKDCGGNLASQRSARSRRFIAIIILADEGGGVREGTGRKGERERIRRR